MKPDHDIEKYMDQNLLNQNDDTNIKVASAIESLNKAANMLDLIKENISSEIVTRVIESVSNKLESGK